MNASLEEVSVLNEGEEKKRAGDLPTTGRKKQS
jgi:hypothetical protein